MSQKTYDSHLKWPPTMSMDLNYDAEKRGARMGRGMLFISVKSTQADLIVANVHPFNLVARVGSVAATVIWEGTETLISKVTSEADEEPWARCIQLVWAIVAPGNAPVNGKFAADRWTCVQLSMPVVDGNLANRVLITLDKESWRAKFSIDDGRRTNLEYVIPVTFRKLDAGSLLYTMCLKILPPR